MSSGRGMGRSAEDVFAQAAESRQTPEFWEPLISEMAGALQGSIPVAATVSIQTSKDDGGIKWSAQVTHRLFGAIAGRITREGFAAARDDEGLKVLVEHFSNPMREFAERINRASFAAEMAWRKEFDRDA